MTLLYGQNVKSKKEFCLTVGLNKFLRNTNDYFMFMTLGSKNRWDVTTLDERNYKIKHNYDNYKMEIFYNIPDEELNFTEVSLAVKNNALFWQPSIEQQGLFLDLMNKSININKIKF